MRAGTVIDQRFEIERLAGSGGMGAVYKARDRRGARAVAVKVLREAVADPEGRFEREVAVLAMLEHPSIVRYVADGRTEAGERYLAMEWLEGEDLAARLARGPLSSAETVKLGLRVASALGAVHRQGVLHRDLKPANLFLVANSLEDVRVLDFGIARLQPGSSGATRTGQLLGTPAYMSPEQARGERVLDARTDVFSLGCVLYECLAGAPSFEGEHVLAVLAKVVLDEVQPLRERAAVPVALESLVHQMLHKERTRRPADGDEVAARLSSLEDEGTLAAPVEAPGLTQRERRLVSVVALAGAAGPSSALEATLTPESSSAQQAALASLVRELGATLEVLADGSRIVVLDHQGEAVDHAARAARCAQALARTSGQQVVALATGRAVLTARGALGEVIERAAELLHAAGSERESATGSIAIDELTEQLLGEGFDVARAPQGSRWLRGAQDAATWTHLVAGRASPCVGRETELAMLQARWSECVAEPIARAVLLTGRAGAGKSRVRYEFLRRLQRQGEARECWLVRGDPMSAGSPLGMARQLLLRAVGARGEDDPASRRARVRARVVAAVPEPERQRVEEFLAECVGAGDALEASAALRAARRDARLMSDQLRRAWQDWLCGECRRGPLLLVLEDLHWSDGATLRLLDAALEAARDLPLFVLALARPEVHESFPALWAAREVTELRLADLSRKASERFVTELLGPGAGAPLVASLVEQAGGHALFLEELVRAALRGDADDTAPSVVAMIQGRLQRLPDALRKVLRAASVFGQTFWLGGVEALLGAPAAPHAAGSVSALLEEAVRAELVVQSERSRYPEQTQYSFRHVLSREGAYALLTEEDRALGHRLAAHWLVARGEQDPLLLAEHFERGEERPRAVTALLRAASLALAANDLEAALRHARRGALLGAHGEELGALRAIEAEAHLWRGETPETESCAKDALRLLSPASAWWWVALKGSAAAARNRTDTERVRELGGGLVAMVVEPTRVVDWAVVGFETAVCLFQLGCFEEADALLARVDAEVARAGLSDPTLEAFAERLRACRAVMRGDYAEAQAHNETASGLFEGVGNQRRATTELVNRGESLCYLGLFLEASEVLRRALSGLERLGLADIAQIARAYLGVATCELGQLESALALERDAVGFFAGRADRYWEGHARRYLALCLHRAGRLEEAEAEARKGCELHAAHALGLAPALGMLARIQLDAGKVGEALASAEKGVETAARAGAIEEGEGLLRLVYAEVLWVLGRNVEAYAALERAHDRLRERAAKVKDEELRRAFLERVPEHARTRALLDEWGLALRGR